MSDISFVTQNVGNGGVVLKAAGLVATTGANATPLTLKKGAYTFVITTTAVEIDTNDELYVLAFEANTVALSSTWKTMGLPMVLGCTEKMASIGDSPAAGVYKVTLDMPTDFQVRDKMFVSGTAGTGINYSVKVYPASNILIS